MKVINENTIKQIVRESLSLLFENNNKFNVFKNHFLKFVNDIVKRADKELEKYELGINIDTEYDFDEEDHWLACYERSLGYIEYGSIEIAINEQRIYEAMKQLGTAEDLEEIETQAVITIMHEVGHGLIDWLRYKFEGTETTSKLINYLVYCDEDEEEEICEEYGESWISGYAGVYDSVLKRALSDYENVDIV